MEEMFFESKSRFGFSETLQKLSDLIPESGWKEIAVLDLQAIMKKNGKEILPVKVVELCKPDYAYRLLSDDSQRIYSNMLPCRISVYEKSDGNCYISRLNAAMMAVQLGGVTEEVMTAAYIDAEEMINKLAEPK
ncbi:MAG TPA: DUF302 domain-containing protein [Proteiniphilum sp.]|nr:DUF302 domain-containing protein [Proteiniphilum sp.]HPD87729.1 DUF302 domain-containing protein [Proteiniphilum sp.]HPJ49647.1 DUF302 domain-containing protein [Proteiniphilum sp.]HPR19864.1 DUF302 domain-containing protein [Proteiniphilum sp.]